MAVVDFDAALVGAKKEEAASGFFAKIAQDIAVFRARRQTKAELEALSDAMLRDIGITRGDINTVVNRL